MKSFVLRFLRLILGLAVCALGIAFTLHARIGYAPWEIFHAGLGQTIGLSIGQASILTGFVIVAGGVLLGEKLGLGTVLNMFLLGTFLDGILSLGLLPTAQNWGWGLVMLLIGMLIISLGSFLYLGSGFGAGPRDSLMVVLNRKSGWPIGLSRSLIELLAALIGWRLGGMLGIGTVISAALMGICIQMVFRLLRFDPKKIQHETFADSFRSLMAADRPL